MITDVKARYPNGVLVAVAGEQCVRLRTSAEQTLRKTCSARRLGKRCHNEQQT